ncbi:MULTISPECIES: ChrR family anti-sigma-E factor [Gammaproteobacteria]|uniref:ChrR family anti-sigma-E factor n=1 Tax=Gammaproteobacteria TaxID=1236 RepID=UPI000DD0C9EC|nr:MULTISPECIES: ChrR family anti-sigma-E factor [Gammaproteobacteria]RTE87327.1 transcriptional regulator [Aliidiomarina sp. B3213]TCZ92887.1 transcriptional regulator [Lysobacter sp. N42]
MIKFHPNDQLIEKYAAGSLCTATSVAVATHVDMCSRCQQQVKDAEEIMARRVLQDIRTPRSANLEAMFEQIIESRPPKELKQEQVDPFISLEGKKFRLPSTLARQKHRIGHWSWVPGKMMKAHVDIGEQETLDLIYMAENSKVPEHTHRGQEITLVLNGVFNDEKNEYRDGDFVLLDKKHTHTPETQHEDCLTLASLDAPLYFTSGIARLLNPFSNLFFK